MSDIENKIKELGLELPAAPAAAGNYLPYRLHGDTLYIAGSITMVNGELRFESILWYHLSPPIA